MTKRTSQKSPSFDVIVIGAGASGLTAVSEFCSMGLSVCLLDGGDALQVLNSFSPFRSRNYPIQSQSSHFHPDHAHLFNNDRENPYVTSPRRPFYWIRNQAPGGRLLLWGGGSYRMTDQDFSAGSRERFGENWPLKYQDLLPYYIRAEKTLQVDSPSLSTLDANEKFIRKKAARLDLPVEVYRRAMENGGSYFNGIPLLQKALLSGDLTYRPFTLAYSLLPGKKGLVKGVMAKDKGTHEDFTVTGKVVVVAASALESTRILLNSPLPELAGNPSLGHYLSDHLGGPDGLAVEGIFLNRKNKEREFLERTKRILYIPRISPQDGGTFPLKRGHSLQVRMLEINKTAVRFFLIPFGEMLPYYSNRVSLHPTKRDKWNLPVLHIRCRPEQNEHAMMREMKKAALRLAGEIVADGQGKILKVKSNPRSLGLCIHEVGTCRMGKGPEDSVLNQYNQSHHLKNLFVTDGSSIPYLGTPTPTLTIMALTLRACSYIKDNFF